MVAYLRKVGVSAGDGSLTNREGRDGFNERHRRGGCGRTECASSIWVIKLFPRREGRHREEGRRAAE